MEAYCADGVVLTDGALIPTEPVLAADRRLKGRLDIRSGRDQRGLQRKNVLSSQILSFPLILRLSSQLMA